MLCASLQLGFTVLKVGFTVIPACADYVEAFKERRASCDACGFGCCAVPPHGPPVQKNETRSVESPGNAFFFATGIGSTLVSNPIPRSLLCCLLQNSIAVQCRSQCCNLRIGQRCERKSYFSAVSAQQSHRSLDRDGIGRKSQHIPTQRK